MECKDLVYIGACLIMMTLLFAVFAQQILGLGDRLEPTIPRGMVHIPKKGVNTALPQRWANLQPAQSPSTPSRPFSS